MSFIATVGDSKVTTKKGTTTTKKKKRRSASKKPVSRKRKASEDTRGIRMVVEKILLIEECEEPGLHIKTTETIRNVSAPYDMVMAGPVSKLKFKATPSDSSECPVLITKEGGGVTVHQSSGSSSFTFTM